MKFKKLLVLSVLSLFGTSAWAEVPEGIWTIPEPQGLEFMEFEEGTHAYLYNPGSKMFFYSGYNWNTRACLSGKAFEIWFVTSTETGAPENSYEFWDLFTNPDRGDVSGDHNVFTDDGGGSYCDHASQANYSWSVTKVGDAYRIQNVALVAAKPEFEGRYLGWDATAPDNIAYMLSPDAEGAFVDWKFVTAESFENFSYSDEYEAYVTACANYGAGNALAVSLKNAEELGINIEAWLAVYTNMESTTEELTKAKEEVDAVVAAKKSLKLLLDQAAEVNAPSAAAQEVYNNADATADELKKAYDSLNPMVSARAELKKALDEAVSVSFDAAEFKAVFDNGESTISQIQKATTDLAAQLVEWGKTHATVDNPSDMTSFIKNPNFDNASFTGWLGTEPNMVGSGSHGPANVAEKWNATFDTYQDITELPAGVYALGAKTSWRGSWNDMEKGVGPAAKLYVTIGENEYNTPFNYIWGCYNTEPLGGTTDFGTSAGENSEAHENEAGESVTYYSPNDPSAFRLYEEKGFYDTKVLFGLSEGSIRIGVKNPSMMGDADNWSCFDTFTLTYYGAGADAAQLYLDESLKNFSEVTIPEETVYTESYLTAYQAAYTGEKTADSFDAAAAIVNGISDAKKALDKNIKLWQDLQDLIQNVYDEYLKNDEYSGIEPEIDYLSDYYEFDSPLVEENYTLTNEELEAELVKVNEWINNLMEKSKLDVYDGKPMTKYIANPTFESKTTENTGNSNGWTITRGDSEGNVTPGPIGGDGDTFLEKCGYYNGCFESWHCKNWDVWQEVKGLPVGMYELEVQGYVRCEVNGYTRGDELEYPYVSPVYLYMNDAVSQFPSVYTEVPAEAGIEFQTIEGWTTEEINGNLYPNSMGGAAQCFHIDKEAGLTGMYRTKAYGLIAKEGDTFRIGVRMDKNEYWWCIWDNFKLTYRTPTVDIVKPELEKALRQLDTTQPMGKNVIAKAQEAKQNGEEALAGNDGQKMFDALAEIYAVMGAVRTSVELFNTLTDAIENETTGLSAAIYTSANDKAKAEAEALVGTITSGMENHDINDDEVAGLLEQIANMKTKLAMPADWESATDDNSADFTGVIVNPAYDEGVNGWSGTGAAWSDSGLNAEIFGKDYDYYQDIIGLPAGTYEVTVQGFYRAGDASTDYNTWIETPDENNNAYLYAAYINGTDTLVSSVPLKRLAAEAESEADGAYLENDYVYAKNPSEEGAGDGWIVPNNMTTASYEFDKEKYNNKVIVKLGSDNATLRIGLKKEVNLDNNWSIWDNWHINYFGKASSKEADGDAATAISTMEAAVAPVKVEFFTIDGRKAIRAQKGVILQKTTLSNGATIIKKIMK